MLLLGFVALAGWESAPLRLRPHVAADRVAVHAGLLLIALVALVLPFRKGGPRRLLPDLLLTLALAAPFAVLAADWAPVTADRALLLGVILATQAALAIAASACGVEEGGRAGAIYLGLIVLVGLGAPFLAYLLGEATTRSTGTLEYASSAWAARPLLLDRAGSLPAGFWAPAVATNLLLAVGFAVTAVLRRRAS